MSENRRPIYWSDMGMMLWVFGCIWIAVLIAFGIESIFPGTLLLESRNIAGCLTLIFSEAFAVLSFTYLFFREEN